MHTVLQDVRFALRVLLKNPLLSAVAVVTLAVAIGANTTIFSVVNAVLLQPLPYPEPDRLVRINTQFFGGGMRYERFAVSPPEYRELQRYAGSYQSIAAWIEGGSPVSGGTEPVRVPAAYLTGPVLQTVGVSPELGRVFSREEDHPGDPSSVVLSHGLWRRAFGSDPHIIGRRISVDARPVTVIGVMPEEFDFPTAATELWIPQRQDLSVASAGSHILNLVARLKPGVTLDQARGELDSFTAWSKETHTKGHRLGRPNHTMVVNSLYSETVASARWSLLLLQGAVAFLLLIAAANIASLLMARAEARSREIAIRAAVGADRMRIIRQLLTESLVLGVLGAGFGLALAVWGVDLAVALLPRGAPRLEEIAIDGWVLAFGIACALLVSLLFGMAPAMNARIDDLQRGLQEGSSRATAGGARLRLRRALVVVEISLAVVLVVGCALMLRSFRRVQDVNLGFEPAGLVTMQIQLPAATYPTTASVVNVWEHLLGDVRRLPGVRAATTMTGMPPYRSVDAADIYIFGQARRKDGPVWNVDYWQVIGDDYFETMGIRVVRGRALDARDRQGAAPVVLINESTARRFWPGKDPVGQRVSVLGDSDDPVQTIVGVVADVKQGGLDRPTGTEVYISMRLAGPLIAAIPSTTASDDPARLMYLTVRADGDPRALVRGVRRLVSRADPNLAVAEVRTMDEILWQAVARPRFFAVLLGGFAGIALLLAAIGTFGVMSYSISQRTREIGIRMALGAPPSRVRRMVLREGMLLVGLGVSLGLAGAAILNTALSRALSDMLFGVEALDPTTFIAVPVLIVTIGALACWLPAARATRVDPILALRHD
jgi:putative ABC transport system permease protein